MILSSNMFIPRSTFVNIPTPCPTVFFNILRKYGFAVMRRDMSVLVRVKSENEAEVLKEISYLMWELDKIYCLERYIESKYDISACRHIEFNPDDLSEVNVYYIIRRIGFSPLFENEEKLEISLESFTRINALDTLRLTHRLIMCMDRLKNIRS